MTESFPLIDIAPFVRQGASAADQAAVVGAVERACRSTGFLAVTGHGVAQSVIQQLVEASYGFFDLGRMRREAARACRPRPEQNRGYIPPGDETLARRGYADTPPDLKELFAIGPFDLPGRASTSPDRTPIRASRPAEKACAPGEPTPALRAYWRALEGLAGTLCRIFARALAPPNGFFDEGKVDKHISQLRIMQLSTASGGAPARPAARRRACRSSAVMTLIYSDNDVGGLQLKDRDGHWVDAPAIRDGS